MNSGKTTLTDLIVIDGALNRGKRFCIVVGSVGDVYAKVSFLRALGIDAIPLIGRSSRGEHAARYWRTMVEESAVLIPDEYHPADPAAAYANTSCLLEPYREDYAPGLGAAARRGVPVPRAAERGRRGVAAGLRLPAASGLPGAEGPPRGGNRASVGDDAAGLVVEQGRACER